MNLIHLRKPASRVTRTAALSLALAGTLVAAAVGTLQYQETDLVSDTGASTPNTDPALVNAWGIAVSTDTVWVANAGSGLVSMISPEGLFTPAHIAVEQNGSDPAEPTGLVLNHENQFLMAGTNVVAPAFLMVATENGTIAGWSPAFQAPKARTVIDRSADGAVYTGLALAHSGGEPYLFAADFANGRVDTFDHAFGLVNVPGGFMDPGLPANYAPFGVQALEDDTLVVTYAFKTHPYDADETTGPGLGVVSQFKANGTFVRRIASNGGDLNAPWGVAQASRSLGFERPALLVGNLGDGRINAFDMATGAPLGALSDTQGRPIVIEGLWGIAATDRRLGLQPRLYFAAGPGDEMHGLYGYISWLQY